MNRTARLRPNCRRLVFGLLLVCSWIFAPALPGQPLRAEAGTATITGKVFYNDRRTFGHFSARRDKAGSPGRRCPKAGQRDDRTSCSTNPLGARYMVVDIIEIDQGFFGPTAWACKKEEIIGSATVKYDGSFTVTVSTDDACKSDGLKVTQVKLSVRTRFCNDTWCISLRDDKRNVYALLHPGASAKKPLKIKAGKTYDVGTMTFSTGGDSSRPTVEGMAANYWASIVDTALTLHNEGGLPFFRNEYGELEYLFPSDKSSTATARSNDEIVISKFQYDTIQVGTVTTRVPAWPSGWTPAHEYGHIVMQRAWGGGYGYKGVGISANDTAIANDPARQIAFKEAWAEFIARVVFDEQAGCGLSSYDINSNTPANGPFGQGASWRSNVTKALCDWYDSRKDDDPGQPGRGDYFAASDIGSMWLNLRSMYVYRKDYGGDYKNPGLWFCDWVSYYLDVRKSAKAVGTAEHARYEDKIRDLIYNNKIGCYMSAPS